MDSENKESVLSKIFKGWESGKSLNIISGETQLSKDIAKLHSLTRNNIFTEKDVHTDVWHFKILCEYTDYKELKFNLCPVHEGFFRAVEIAIENIEKERKIYYEKHEIEKN